MGARFTLFDERSVVEFLFLHIYHKDSGCQVNRTWLWVTCRPLPIPRFGFFNKQNTGFS